MLYYCIICIIGEFLTREKDVMMLLLLLFFIPFHSFFINLEEERLSIALFFLLLLLLYCVISLRAESQNFISFFIILKRPQREDKRISSILF